MRTTRLLHTIALCSLIWILGCQPATRDSVTETPPTPVAHALDGTPLFPPPESAASKALKDSLLHIAEANYVRDSADLNNIIWYGRRLAYLSRYPEAIDVYARGLRKHPMSPELLRHRGHRYITIRKFDQAVTDLRNAADAVQGRPIETEPDGIPNALNIPLSSLQFNIWYHLGLAHYLQGDYELAAAAYDSCMMYSINTDLLTATTDWYYMTLLRLDRTEDAVRLLEPITPAMEVIENDGYLQRLLMYKGLVPPERLINLDAMTEENQLQVVTQGYGVANHFIAQGDALRGNQLLRDILKTDYWPAFGYIAAEADLHRRQH